GADHTSIAEGAPRLRREDAGELLAEHLVHVEHLPLDGVTAELLARLGLEQGSHQDLRFAVAGQVTGRGVQDVPGLLHSHRDERVSEPLPKPPPEADAGFSTDPRSLRALASAYVRHEFGTRWGFAGPAIPARQAVDLLEELVGVRRSGGEGRRGRGIVRRRRAAGSRAPRRPHLGGPGGLSGGRQPPPLPAEGPRGDGVPGLERGGYDVDRGLT